MEYIRDMLYVNNVERRLGRELTEQEMVGESERVRFPDGHLEFIDIPLLEFPNELIEKFAASDLFENCQYLSEHLNYGEPGSQDSSGSKWNSFDNGLRDVD